MRSVVDWIAIPASGVTCSIRRAKSPGTHRGKGTEGRGARRRSRSSRPSDGGRADAECDEGVYRQEKRGTDHSAGRARVGDPDLGGYAGGT